MEPRAAFYPVSMSLKAGYPGSHTLHSRRNSCKAGPGFTHGGIPVGKQENSRTLIAFRIKDSVASRADHAPPFHARREVSLYFVFAFGSVFFCSDLNFIQHFLRQAGYWFVPIRIVFRREISISPGLAVFLDLVLDESCFDAFDDAAFFSTVWKSFQA